MILNLTPHPIRLYSPATPDRIHELDDLNTGLIAIIEPEETPVRVATTEVSLGVIFAWHDGQNIPTVLIEYGTVEDLPERRNGVQLIVSPAVAVATRGRSDLLVPYSEVRNTTGTVVGCRLLASPC